MLNFALFIRILAIPFFRYIAPLFSKKIAARVDFELKNYTEVPVLQKAEYGFEISSEGELEQIKIVLLEVLNKGKTVELIFCSPSVESQCKELLELYPSQLRIYRFPIFSYNPFSKISNPMKWMTCKTFIMCRYDFFPELIMYGEYKAERFILLAGSLKNFDQKNFLIKKYLTSSYKAFDQVVTVTEEDRTKFKQLMNFDSLKLEVYDFRILQIMNRLLLKEEKIKSNLVTSELLLTHLNSITTKKVLFGSYWKQEFGIFKKSIKEFIQDGTTVFLAPHQLDSENIKSIKEDFIENNIKVYEITNSTDEMKLKDMISKFNETPGVWILNIKGILCELYAYFDFAYVGGGFGTSIHSVLEPFIAGAVVFCGPKVHRSTEYSLIKESNPDRLYKVDKKNLVLTKMKGVEMKGLSSTDPFLKHYKDHKDIVLKWLGI